MSEPLLSRMFYHNTYRRYGLSAIMASKRMRLRSSGGRSMKPIALGRWSSNRAVNQVGVVVGATFVATCVPAVASCAGDSHWV